MINVFRKLFREDQVHDMLIIKVSILTLIASSHVSDLPDTYLTQHVNNTFIIIKIE